MRMKESEFDDVMSKALGVASPPPDKKQKAKPKNKKKRLSAYPRKKKS
jgi:hypothetical protein